MSRDEMLERLEREVREWRERLEKQNCELLKQVETVAAEIVCQGELLRKVMKDSAVRKEFYTVEEFAALVGRKKFTVRQWCNLGLIAARKSFTRSGPCNLWAISHEEYLRYQREGLRPDARHVQEGARAMSCRSPGGDLARREVCSTSAHKP
jgi:hypothetical protein